MREKREQKEEMGQEYWAKKRTNRCTDGQFIFIPSSVFVYSCARVCAHVCVCVCVDGQG